jgi:hypothetical protein
MRSGASAIIVENPHSTAVDLLRDALERSGFWKVIARARTRSKVPAKRFHVLIKPDLGAFDVPSPAATDPKLVETLIDLLHAKGYPRTAVCSAPDSSFFWAENRDVAVLADLLGYKFVTPGGREYDIIDLSENLADGGFREGGVLFGGELAQAWRDANFRICFAKNKTGEQDGYALCLDSLLDVLPLLDKDYYYRHRVPAGAAVAELLHATPVHFGLIDATISAHGPGGSRAPAGIQTNCVIASESVLLADYVGALKMGLDPKQSELADRVFTTIGVPQNYTIDGSLAVYPGWQNVHPLIMDSHRLREKSPTVSRLLRPWLQTLNTEIFPLRHPIDARVNANVSALFADVGKDPAAFWLLVAANYALGNLNRSVNTYRILYDKDSLRHVQAPLGLRLEDYSEADYRAIVAELSVLENLLKDVEPAAENLRWRYVDRATVFEFSRELPIDFDEFVRHVDVAKTIQYMNDYIGGVAVPVKRDASGRVLLQAERNLYLPQPNYLALYQGKEIDVSKLEVCEYSEGSCRMFWKTVKSENDSAIYDDGIVIFTRAGDSTRVQIIGRQLFVLPPFWQAVNLDLVPDFKAALVTHAYKTFFDRTYANLEALVEGREIRIGRPWRRPESFDDAEPFPVQIIQDFFISLGEKLQSLFKAAGGFNAMSRNPAPAPFFVDENGFRHFRPGSEPPPSEGNSSTSSAGRSPLQEALEEISSFYSGLCAAVTRDGLDGVIPSGSVQSFFSAGPTVRFHSIRSAAPSPPASSPTP